MTGWKITIFSKGITPRELTCPTLGKGKSSSKVIFVRDMLVPWRVHLQMAVFPLSFLVFRGSKANETYNKKWVMFFRDTCHL